MFSVGVVEMQFKIRKHSSTSLRIDFFFHLAHSYSFEPIAKLNKPLILSTCMTCYTTKSLSHNKCAI